MAMENMRNAYEILVRNPKVRYHLEPLCVVGKIIFNLLLSEQYMWLSIGFVWLKTGLSGRLL
jgi:hypothetical protein